MKWYTRTELGSEFYGKSSDVSWRPVFAIDQIEAAIWVVARVIHPANGLRLQAPGIGERAGAAIGAPDANGIFARVKPATHAKAHACRMSSPARALFRELTHGANFNRRRDYIFSETAPRKSGSFGAAAVSSRRSTANNHKRRKPEFEDGVFIV